MTNKPKIMFDQIKTMIADPGIKLISFDIFDTLLVRPSCFPTDIFYLLDGEAKEILHDNSIDFYSIRLRAEAEAKEELAKNNHSNGEITLTQIYDFISRKYNVEKTSIQKLIEAEIKLEADILRVRKPIIEIYREALSSGKKVVLTSDFYFEKENLEIILKSVGITGYYRLYISSELKKRKDTGELYTELVKNENVKPSEILHLGDNYNSDVISALNSGLTAFHIPSNYEIFFSDNLMHKNIWKDIKLFSPSERILLGIIINKVANDFLQNENYTDTFADKFSLGYYGLGPFLFSLAHFIISNEFIQNNYNNINFASRDGYLPKIIYDLIRNNRPEYLESRYIYGGRQAYNIASYEGDVFKYLTAKTNHLSEYTLVNLFDTLVKKNYLDEKYPSEWLNKSNFNEDKEDGFKKLKKILSKHHAEIKQILDERKNSVSDYYNKEINLNNERRSITFDVGYSGSISEGISPLINGKVDKLYLWQTRKNEISDKKNGTNSIVLCGYQDEDKEKPPVFLAIEELFSPLEKSCTGFKKAGDKIFPIFEDELQFPAKMKNDLKEIQEGTITFAKDVLNILDKYSKHFQFSSIHKFLNPFYYSFNSATDNSIHLLDDICFNDNFSRNNQISLSSKIEERNKNYFHRTNFLREELIFTNRVSDVSQNKLRIGIHLHLYNIEQAPLFVHNLQNAPYKFDLFISIVNKKYKEIVSRYFNHYSLPSLEKIVIEVFPNRGRDVAPWLVGFNKELKTYDLVCHIHTKKSVHFNWGNSWSEYLLDNLISPAAFSEIVNYFNTHEDLGVVFPPIYHGIYKFWVENSYSHLGLYNLPEVCSALLQKIGIKKDLDRNAVFFSVGNMFWYRTKALTPLLNLNLKYTNFPEEPIPVDGTIAHAIERLHSIVADSQGYKTINYINQDELIDKYHKNVLVNVLDLDDHKENLKELFDDLINIFLEQERFFDAVLILYRFYREKHINTFIKDKAAKIQKIVNEKIDREGWNSNLRTSYLKEAAFCINNFNYPEAKSKLNVLLNYEPMNLEALKHLVVICLEENNIFLAFEINNLLLSVKPTKESLKTHILIKKLWDSAKNKNKLYDKNEIIRKALNEIKPGSNNEILTSIIIPTFNQYEYTKLCIESILKHTKNNYEIIVVDNASTDETTQEINKNFPDVNLITNNENKGFPIAINQGIRKSKGEFILLLNNDTIVTDGWLERLIEVAQSEEKIGIVGPISNSVSGIQIDKEANYTSISQMHKHASEVKVKNRNATMEFPRVAFLCTLIKKNVIEKIGGLDERFTPGNFEDDDYCLRAQLSGFKTVIAKDVFIHHFGSKSFTSEGTNNYRKLLESNKNVFVEKWGGDPEEIWLKGKSINKRKLFFPIEITEFLQSYKRSLIHLEDKDFLLAYNAIKNAIKLYNSENQEINKTALYILAGNIALIISEYKTAREYFEKALNINPESSEACTGLAEIFFIEENYEDANTMFDWALKSNPENKIAAERKNQLTSLLNKHDEQELLHENLLTKAVKYFSNKDYLKAEEELSVSEKKFNGQLSEDKNNEFASVFYNLRGYNYLGLQEPKKAQTCFESALNKNPNSSQACSGLGEIFYLNGQLDESKVMFEWAVKNNIQNEFALNGLNKINHELGLEQDHNSLLIEK